MAYYRYSIVLPENIPTNKLYSGSAIFWNTKTKINKLKGE